LIIEETILWFTEIGSNVFFLETLGAFMTAHAGMHHRIGHKKK
jgi:hypothetical protein